MIDVHTHYEQKDYDKDRDDEIVRLKEKLKAIVNCCTHPRDWDKGIAMIETHPNFVFLSAGIHPMYVEEFSDEEWDSFYEKIRENKDKIVSVGESGLDYSWVTSEEGRKLQRERFVKQIQFAKSIDKPLTIHCRDSKEDLVEILEEQGYHNIHWHLFKYGSCTDAVIRNNWMVSVGPLIHSSKTVRKIVERIPLSQIMLETDSPWWGGDERGTSLNIIKVAEKIAEIKGLSFDEVWEACGKNAIDFFGLRQ